MPGTVNAPQMSAYYHTNPVISGRAFPSSCELWLLRARRLQIGPGDARRQKVFAEPGYPGLCSVWDQLWPQGDLGVCVCLQPSEHVRSQDHTDALAGILPVLGLDFGREKNLWFT